MRVSFWTGSEEPAPTGQSGQDLLEYEMESAVTDGVAPSISSTHDLLLLMSKKPSLPFIDYAAVKAATTIEMVLQHYGLLEKMNPKGPDTLRGCCPVHHGTDDSQFAVTLSKNLWRCFSDVGCVSGGNHLDLVKCVENCTLHEAAWRMNEWFSLGMEKQAAERTRPSRSSPPSKEKSSPAKSERKSTPVAEKPVVVTEPEEEPGENKPLAFALQNLDASHPYLAERGLTPETIAEFGLGFCSKGIMAGRIAIPIHNPAGELIGNAGRWPGDPPEGKDKYRLPGEFKKTLELFNAHRAFAESAELPLVIVPSYFAVFSFWKRGFNRVVALMGTSLSSRQEELIRNHVAPAGRIVLLLGHGIEGKEARLRIAARLAEHGFVRSFPFSEDIRPSELL